MSADKQKRDSSVRRRVSVEQEADEYARRHFVNLVSAAFLLLLAVAMVWTVKAFDRQETTRNCLASGRKDCIQITAPSVEMRQTVR